MGDPLKALGLDPNIDPIIAPIVVILNEQGVETFESCQGGEGHAFFEPTVRFYGGQSEGFRAFDVTRTMGLDVLSLRRVWDIEDGEPVGPRWEMTFRIPGQPVMPGRIAALGGGVTDA